MPVPQLTCSSRSPAHLVRPSDAWQLRSSLHWLAALTVLWSLVGTAGTLKADEPAPQAEAKDAVEERLNAIFSGGVPESVDDLRAMQQRQQKLAGEVIECTVGVRIGQAQGSGVIISEDGYVLTAAHVAQRPNLDVVFILPSGDIVRGKTLGLNRTIDSGLMKITEKDENGEDRKWPFAEMGDSTEVKPGQWCMVTGHPGGYQRGRRPVVRFGRILANYDEVVVTDCPLVGGDSGGPLFDMEGKIIGIHSRIGGALTANMHVPVNTYRETWDRLVDGEIWGRVPRGSPYIGIKGDPQSQQARLLEVEPGMPADRAGLRAGDVVLKFDDQPISDFQSLVLRVSEKRPGDKVVVQVQRGEEMLELELIIGRKRSD